MPSSPEPPEALETFEGPTSTESISIEIASTQTAADAGISVSETITVSEASVPISEASVTVSEASATVSEASVTISEASVTISEASVPISEASVPISEASVPVSEASVPISEASVPISDIVSETSVVPETLAASVVPTVASVSSETSDSTLHASVLSSSSPSTSISSDTSDNAGTGVPPIRNFCTHIYMSDYDCDLSFSAKGSEVSTRTDGGFCYLWSGGRASHGVFRGKFGYQVKILENLPLPPDMPPAEAHKAHICRLGWSVLPSPVSKLGEVPQSYGFGGTGMKSSGGQFFKYGSPFGAGDIITCLVDFDQKTVSYAMNGKLFPGAFSGISGTLFPHLLLKNIRCEVDFFDGFLPPGYKAMAEATSDDVKLGPLAPVSQQECEVIMLVGLPQCGKTAWARNKAATEPQKHWNILGTDLNIDKMKIENLHRDRNYHERWEQLIQLATNVFNTQLALAATTKRNFILDQTNVFKHARQRKLEPFHSFKKTAAVMCVNEVEHARRRDQSQKLDGKIIPDKAMTDMIQGFVLPNASESIFSRVDFLELNEHESQALLARLKADIHSGKRPFEVISTPAHSLHPSAIPSLPANPSFQPNKRPAPSYPAQRQGQHPHPDTSRTDLQRSFYSRDSRSDSRVEPRNSRPGSYSRSSRDSRGPASYESRDRPDGRDAYYSGKSDSRSSRADYGRDSLGHNYGLGRSDSHGRHPSPPDSHRSRDYRTGPSGPPSRGPSRDSYPIKKEEPTDYTNQSHFSLPLRQSSREPDRSARGTNVRAESYTSIPDSQRRDISEYSKSTPYPPNVYVSDPKSTYSSASTPYYEQAASQFYKQEPTNSQTSYSQPPNYHQQTAHFPSTAYSQSFPSFSQPTLTSNLSQTPAYYPGVTPTYIPSANYSQSNPQNSSNFSYPGFFQDAGYGQSSQVAASIPGSYPQGAAASYYAGAPNFPPNISAMNYSNAARPFYQQYQQPR